MKVSRVSKATVRIAVIDGDPVRFVGFRALLSAESDFESGCWWRAAPTRKLLLLSESKSAR
jgi:hypothetical protein